MYMYITLSLQSVCFVLFVYMAERHKFYDNVFPTGTIRNISPQLWKLNHLRVLYMTDNQLTRVPADICQLTQLIKLDLSYNKLRSLPVEIGDLISLR